MKVYHRTPEAEAILNDGFLDTTGTYMTVNEYTGVFVSDTPLDVNNGAAGMTTLVIKVPEDILKQHEWIQEGLGYREFLIPASILNRYGSPEIDEHDYQGCKLTDILREITAFRRNGNDEEAGWLEHDIPLLQKHGLLAIEDDDSAPGFRDGK